VALQPLLVLNGQGTPTGPPVAVDDELIERLRYRMKIHEGPSAWSADA
jgi:hypothetical protein